MKEKKQKSAEQENNQMLRGVVAELEKYLEKLQKEATLCHNEAKRALERSVETEELFFRINEEKMDVNTFLCALLKIITFEIPQTGARFVFIPFERQIPRLIKKIETLIKFLYSVPGVRMPDEPEDYGKIKGKYWML